MDFTRAIRQNLTLPRTVKVKAHQSAILLSASKNPTQSSSRKFSLDPSTSRIWSPPYPNQFDSDKVTNENIPVVRYETKPIFKSFTFDQDSLEDDDIDKSDSEEDTFLSTKQTSPYKSRAEKRRKAKNLQTKGEYFQTPVFKTSFLCLKP